MDFWWGLEWVWYPAIMEHTGPLSLPMIDIPSQLRTCVMAEFLHTKVSSCIFFGGSLPFCLVESTMLFHIPVPYPATQKFAYPSCIAYPCLSVSSPVHYFLAVQLSLSYSITSCHSCCQWWWYLYGWVSWYWPRFVWSCCTLPDVCQQDVLHHARAFVGSSCRIEPRAGEQRGESYI